MILLPLDICVNKKAPPTHSVHQRLNPLQKHHPFFFAKPPLKSTNYPSLPF